MQELEDLVAHPGGHCLSLLDCRGCAAGQDRLGKLQVPVAVDVPDEPVERFGSFFETERLKRSSNLMAGLLQLVRDPAIERLLSGHWIEGAHGHAIVHFRKSGRIPELGSKLR